MCQEGGHSPNIRTEDVPSALITRVSGAMPGAGADSSVSTPLFCSLAPHLSQSAVHVGYRTDLCAESSSSLGTASVMPHTRSQEVPGLLEASSAP